MTSALHLTPSDHNDWYRNHNVYLNVNKPKGMIIDFGRACTHRHLPLTIHSATIGSSTRFLGVDLEDDLTMVITVVR